MRRWRELTIAICLQLLVVCAADAAPNLVPNPGMEQLDAGVPRGWTVRSTTDGNVLRVFSDAAQRHDDERSLRVEVLQQTQWSSYVGTDVAVKPHTVYTASAWVKQSEPGVAVLNMKSTDMRTDIASGGSPFGEWNRASVVFDSGEFDRMRLLLRTSFRPPKSVSWWDDVSLVEGEIRYPRRNPRMTLKAAPRRVPELVGGCWPSERIIYRDECLGMEVWRMTDHPGLDWHRYYDVSPWSPDGMYIAFYAARPGGSGVWLMNADGGRIRPLRLPPELSRMRSPMWAPRGHLLYVGGENVVAIDVDSGAHRVVTHHEPEMTCSDIDVSADGKWLAYGQFEGSMWLASTDGTVQRKLMEGGIDHYRFVTPDGSKLVCNDDGDTKMWMINADGSGRHLLIDRRFSHPDRTPDFKTMTFVEWAQGEGHRIGAIDMDGTNERVLVRAPFVHQSVSNDGRWIVGDSGYAGNGPATVGVASIAGQWYQWLAYHDSVFAASRGSRHPAAQSTHPHPYFSPDDTKFVFNSGLTWTNSEMLVLVFQAPAPPVEARQAGLQLSWQPPTRAKELRGYNVYGANTGAMDYELLTKSPVRKLSFHPTKFRHHAVTAVEHSGLESLPAFTSAAPTRWYEIEALCEPNADLRPDGRASGSWAVLAEGGGIAVQVPDTSSAHIWLRARAPEAAKLVVRRPSETATIELRREWTWHQLTAVRGGVVRLGPTQGPCYLDQLLLTDQPELVPTGPARLNAVAPPPPHSLQAAGVTRYEADLTWAHPAHGTVHHFAVYRSTEPDLVASNRTIVGTPASAATATFHDWGLEPGTRYYYKVTAIDRWWNESEAAGLHIRTTSGEPAILRLEAEAAHIVNGCEIVSDATAQGGKYVRTLAGDVAADARLRFEVRVPAASEYVLWGCACGPDGVSDSFFVSIDGRKRALWDVDWREWRWAMVGDRTGGTPVLWHLTPGKHTVEVERREAGARLDAIILTNDLRFDPRLDT